ncbi:hypothetical protein TrST_g1220 [Triparma strigata]|uniref:Methylenetetrahydrofolate dehydrogenase n=1 Tax=Triparma strigata TaxID=1606541 RepID=A0A9W7A631_9STRA|nr:hypothetical protein TrST_g1220 [Triparma strigata]
MPGEKVVTSKIALTYKDEIRDFLASLPPNTPAPLLVGLLATSDPAAESYANWTKKAFEEDGLRYEVRKIEEQHVEEALAQCNDDPNVHGIIVYYPIFGLTPSYSGSSHDDYLRDSVSVQKDVEGLTFTYRTSLYKNIRYLNSNPNSKCVLPCTALSCVKILEHCGVYAKSPGVHNRLQGKTCTIINRSEIVGRPLAAMLANDGATVYSCDVDSIYKFEAGGLRRCDEGTTVKSVVEISDVVVTGVPVKSYKLPTEWIKENTVVINVASFKNVDADELLKIDGVKYVPMVGKVTVKMLERNLCRLYKQYHMDRKGDGKGDPRDALVKQARDFAAIAAVGALSLLALKLAGIWRHCRK